MHRTPGGFTSPLRDVHAVYDSDDILHALAVGDGGVVLKLNPSNETWSDINSTSRVLDLNSQPARLTAIHMIDEDIAWCVGLDGALAFTVNGGTTWTSAGGQGGSCTSYNPGGHDPFDIHDIHFFDAQYGILCGEGQWLGITSNGGCTWSQVDVLSEGACPEIDSEEAALGIPLVLRQLAFEDPADYQSVGYVVGGQGPRRGHVFQKASWSAAWEQVRCYDEYVELNASFCATPSVQGVAALASTGTRAITGGQVAQVLAYGPGTLGSFDPCDSPCAEEEPTSCGSTMLAQYGELDFLGVAFWPALNRAAAISSTEACIVGDYGRIVRIDSTESPGDECLDVGTYALLDIRDGLFFVDSGTGDPSIGYVVGRGRSLLLSQDSGLNWEKLDLGHGSNQAYFTAIDGTAPDTAVIVGTAGNIARTDSQQVDGWGEVSLTALFPPPASAPDWSAVSFAPGTSTVFAVGATGTCIKSTDAGATWALVTSVGQDVLGLAFGTASIGYACGPNSAILRTVDSGASWSAMTVTGTPPSVFTDIVTWDSGTKAVAVGTGGKVYELVSGSFTPVSLGGAAVTTDLNDVERVGSGADLRICGNAGVVLFRDSGTWTSKKSHTNSNLVKLSFPLANEGYAIGGPSYVAAYY